MRKKLLDYILGGGIKGRYFIGNEYDEGGGSRNGEHILTIYQVIGHNGIDNTIPPNPKIKIQYLGRKNREEDGKREEWLGLLLRDREATSEEVKQAKTRNLSDLTF